MGFYRLLAVVGLALMLAAPAIAGSAKPHPLHAFVGARLLVRPGVILENGTLIVKEGRIVAAGSNLAMPAGARVHRMEGRVIHAGFIDPYVWERRLAGKSVRPTRGKDEEDDSPPPARTPTPSKVSGANPQIQPDRRMADHLTLKPSVLEAFWQQGFLVAQVVPDKGLFRGQATTCWLRPGEVREQVIQETSAAVIGLPDMEWESFTEKSYPGSRMGQIAQIRQTLSDVEWYRKARALDAAAYRGTRRPTVESGLEALAPVLAGASPLVAEGNNLLDVLRLFKVMDERNVPRTTVVLSGQEWMRPEWMRPLVTRGHGFIVPLDFEAAPAATSDAEWLDVPSAALEAWKYGPALPRYLSSGGVPFALSTHRIGKVPRFKTMLARALQAGWTEEAALAALTTEPARLLGLQDRLGTLDAGKAATFVVSSGGPLDPKSRVVEVWIEGERHVPVDPGDAPAADKSWPFTASDVATPPPPPSAFRPPAVLVRNATIWTVGPQGTLQGADLLVSNGRIASVGKQITAPPNAVVVDGTGLHVTPGIIDSHSHVAIDGDVNEATRSVTAEVRIKDVVNPFDRNIFYQLAGGVTTSHLMHGSANTIGGQTVVVKWRWGAAPDAMLMAGIPEGIKFALGENVKQSNWGDKHTTRYPQTRMGVAELIRERFVAAKEYRRARSELKDGVPVRPDFQLDTLLELLDGTRLIHCHSYRQDEILALLRIAEVEGFKIKSLHHVLEGYKVADEIAKHGAGCATFTDWWAYKYEVIDAIPYNGALLQERGVATAFKSDSVDHARRLNVEAAKAIKYGGVTPEAALRFATLDAAVLLGIEARVGSLEPGKDGDFVIWAGHPLTARGVALQTWVDGVRYYHRDEAVRLHAEEMKRRQGLIDAARKAAGGKKK